MPERRYRLALPDKEPLVTVLMLNSNESSMSSKDWQAQRQWMEAELGKPRAPWTICGGHPCLWSVMAESLTGHAGPSGRSHRHCRRSRSG